MIEKFLYHSENSAIAKIENFSMSGDFRYIAKIQVVANFHCLGTVHHCSIASCGYYSHCSIPFLLALIFFIPGLLKLIKIHMKLMEINPTLL